MIETHRNCNFYPSKIYIHIYIFIYIHEFGVNSLHRVLNYRVINRLSDKDKELLWNLKFYAVLLTIFSQLTLALNFQCYSIFSTSPNVTSTEVKNIPQLCDDSAYQKTLLKTLHTLSARWGKDPGITSAYPIYVYIWIFLV